MNSNNNNNGEGPEEEEGGAPAGGPDGGLFRPPWVPVGGSSNVEAVAWWHDRDLDAPMLAVAFLAGGPGRPQRVYRYARVPYQTFLALLRSPSKGTYLHRHVKGRYDCLEVTGHYVGP